MSQPRSSRARRRTNLTCSDLEAKATNKEGCRGILFRSLDSLCSFEIKLF
jgi:hypothetical protein